MRYLCLMTFKQRIFTESNQQHSKSKQDWKNYEINTRFWNVDTGVYLVYLPELMRNCHVKAVLYLVQICIISISAFKIISRPYFFIFFFLFQLMFNLEFVFENNIKRTSFNSFQNPLIQWNFYKCSSRMFIALQLLKW